MLDANQIAAAINLRVRQLEAQASPASPWPILRFAAADPGAKDMIAVRMAPETRRVVVGAPSYSERRPRRFTPRDLTVHACSNLRLSTQAASTPGNSTSGTASCAQPKREVRSIQRSQR